MGTELGDALRRALLGNKRAKAEADAKPEPAKTTAPRRSGPARTPATDSPRPRVRAVRVGPVEPHALFRDSSTLRGFERLKPQNNGIARQLTKNATNAADLILGLDFGTAASKAVIRDHTSDRSYAVPFGARGENRYVLPTTVFRGQNGYTLDRDGVRCSNLKMTLLDCGAKLPVEEFDNACAFLALMIRHCRGWFLERYSSVYQVHALTWKLNMGLPARSYEDEHRVRLFRRLAFAAANLAADSGKPTISGDDVRLYRELALEAYADESDDSVGAFEFRPRDIDVVPEIAAQVFGFVHSSFWDSLRRPYIALMDVGAATVDTAFFGVLPQASNELRFVFYSTDVRPLGVTNLHRARVGWIDEALVAGNVNDGEIRKWLGTVGNVAAELARLPERAEDYLSGLEYQPLDGHKPVDTEYVNDRVLPQISGCIAQARREQNLFRESLSSVPLFVCGGGARLRLYGGTVDELNRMWNGHDVTLQRTELPLPPSFEAPGLPSAEYDRLSVAYGLSWHGAGGHRLGEVIRRAQIPPRPEESHRDLSENYISKDQV